jgi:hypothetical protein
MKGRDHTRILIGGEIEEIARAFGSVYTYFQTRLCPSFSTFPLLTAKPCLDDRPARRDWRLQIPYTLIAWSVMSSKLDS